MAYASGGKTGVGFDVHDDHSEPAEQERPFYDTELHARLAKVHAALLKGRLP